MSICVKHVILTNHHRAVVFCCAVLLLCLYEIFLKTLVSHPKIALFPNHALSLFLHIPLYAENGLAGDPDPWNQGSPAHYWSRCENIKARRHAGRSVEIIRLGS